MSLRCMSVSDHARRPPRASGDEPVEAALTNLTNESAPRQRG